MRKNKNKILAGIIIAFVLAFVYWWGGDSPGLRGWEPNPTDAPVTEITPHEERPSVSETDKPEENTDNDVPIKAEDETAAEENKPQKADGTPMTAEEKTQLAEQMNGGSVASEKGDGKYSEESGDLPGLRDWEPNSTDSPATETTSPEEIPSVSETDKPEENTDNDVPIKAEDETATEENKPQKADGTPMTAEEKTQLAEKMNGDSVASEKGDRDYSEESGMEIDHNTGKDKYQTDPVPEGRPVPIEPENAIISDKELTCTLSVRCDTILDNIAWLDKEKVELVPKDGVIFAEQSVTFYEGESVFNLLLREMKKNKIHMEFENTPIYNSAYIEGIGNLYEFDCGELSGWMYCVNGWFPNYGCSRYQLKAGDKVEWVYTCNLGEDVGGSDSTRNGLDNNE